MPPLDPEPNDEEKQEKLDQDFDTPFAVPSDTSGTTTSDPQAIDPNLEDSQELYDEGIAPQATSPPSKDSAEEGFDVEPTADEV